MKKYLIIYLLVLLSAFSFAQTPNNTNTKFPNGLAAGDGATNKPTLGLTAGALWYKTGTGFQVYDGTQWVTLGIAGAGVTSFNGRTGAVVPLVGDYPFFPLYNGTGATGTWGIDISGNAGTVTNGVYTTGSYANPSWITSLSWSKITGTPTTLSGYGITDGVPSSRTLTINGTAQDLSADRTWTITANTPNSLTAGNGITLPTGFNGSVARTVSADTSILAPKDYVNNFLTKALAASTYQAIASRTTVGNSFYTLANPSAITFPRINADNSVSALDAASFRTAIGAGTGGGSVTLIGTNDGTGITGGPITTTGSLGLDTANIVANKTWVNGRLSSYPDPSATQSNALTFTTGFEALPGGGEINNIMQANGTTVDQWYRIAGDTDIYYRTANNALLDNWGSSTLCTGLNGLFPTVFQVGSTYYMFLNPADYVTSKNVFLYSSTDKINWTILNGGNSVITNTPTGTDWFNTMYNVGVAVVGNTMHILIEGTASTGTYSGTAWLGYASAPLSNPNFTLSSTPVFKGGNAFITYVPDKNSLAVLYGEIYPQYSGGLWRLRGATADLSAPLNNTNSWVISDTYWPEMGEVADPDLIFTPGKTHPSLFTYNLDQVTGYQAYSDDVHDANSLYNAITKISAHKNVAFTNVDVINDGSAQKVGFSVQAKTALSTGSQPGYAFKDNLGITKFSIYYDVATNQLAIGNSSGSGIQSIDQSGNVGNGGTITATGFIGPVTGSATSLATPRTIGTATGDVTSAGSTFNGTANNTNVYTLANANANPGSYGNGTSIPTIDVNIKGLITSIGSTPVTPAVGSITGLGSGVGAWLATPSSANLATAVTDETGSGALVFAGSPALTGTPTAPTATGGTNTTQIATTAFVQSAVGGVNNWTRSSGQIYPTTTTDAIVGANGLFSLGNTPNLYLGSSSGTGSSVPSLFIYSASGANNYNTSVDNTLGMVWKNGSNAQTMALSQAGNLFVGSSSNNYIRVQSSGGADSYFQSVASFTNVISDGGIRLQPNSTTALTLSTSGALRLNAYTAGALTTDASGNVTAASDSTIKERFKPFTRGLADLKYIVGKSYHYTKESGLDTINEYTSLIAQNVKKYIPEAVFDVKDGQKFSIQDRPIIATMINGINELAAKAEAQDKLIKELQAEVKALKK